MPTGTLYVVATPLGNLADLTPRAAELLRRVPVVAAEDTRRTRQLLAHLGAHPRLISFHEHSPPTRVRAFLERLQAGDDVALVTDAGTPAVSDPGPELVRAAHNAGVPVSPLPGVSAVTAALSVSGYAADRYTFLGFPPRKGRARREWIESARRMGHTVVAFEAPGRLAALVQDLAAVMPERRALVARELTKRHEELIEGPLKDLARRLAGMDVMGEITLVIEGAPGQPDVPEEDPADALERRATQLLASGLSPSEAVHELVAATGARRNLVYRIVMEAARGSS